MRKIITLTVEDLKALGCELTPEQECKLREYDANLARIQQETDENDTQLVIAVVMITVGLLARMFQ